ncbi:MAG: phosphopantothenoylcysteine decarboxylase [Saprospiraceae bacterium]
MRVRKEGTALARECKARGADVTLILGPVNIPDIPDVEVIKVVSANDMFEAVKSSYKGKDIVIFAAAVADYRPAIKSDIKIKKSNDDLVLDLIKTQDIARYVGENKEDKQFLVGFALENNNELENAISKLKKKNFDMIVLNSLNDKGAGFGYDTNKITIIRSLYNKMSNYELKDKNSVAKDIIDQVIEE